MRIGINAISLEEERKGVGRYLINILSQWVTSFPADKYILYLRSDLQKDEFLHSSNVRQVVLRGPFGKPLRPIWEHIMLPCRIWFDRIDILFSPSYTLPYIMPCLRSCRSAVVLHDISYHVLPDSLDWKSKMTVKYFSKRSALTSDIIITVSNFSREEIIREYGVSTNKIIVTYEASDPQFSLETEKHALNRFREANDLLGDYLLYVGTMFKRRNVPSLLKAFKILAQEIPVLKLVLVGRMDSSNAETVTALIKDPAIRSRVVHYKCVSDEELCLLYNGATVFVYLSSYEGFGLPPLEAMACGTPVIVGRGSSLAEIVGEAGISVDPHKADEIARSIRQILQNSEIQKSFVDKGLQRAKEFSWAKCAADTRRAFDSLFSV